MSEIGGYGGILCGVGGRVKESFVEVKNKLQFISHNFPAYIVKTMFIGEYCERLYRREGCVKVVYEVR